MTAETVTFPSILDPANADRAQQHLEDYYGLRLHPRPDLGWRKSRSALESPHKKGSDMSVFGFVGAYYDRWDDQEPGESDPHPDTFTAADLGPVRYLGLAMPANVLIDILDRRPGDFNTLLARIPRNVDVWNITQEVVDSVRELEYTLRWYSDVAFLTSATIMARKRPRLVPAFDKDVKRAFKAEENKTFMWPLYYAFRTDYGQMVLDNIRAVKKRAGLPSSISVLRAMEVITWMEHRRV